MFVLTLASHVQRDRFKSRLTNTIAVDVRNTHRILLMTAFKARTIHNGYSWYDSVSMVYAFHLGDSWVLSGLRMVLA